jgi:transposase
MTLPFATASPPPPAARPPDSAWTHSSSHRGKKTLAWVAKQKRLHLTFTATHASWLNQIEIWFGILTR